MTQGTSKTIIAWLHVISMGVFVYALCNHDVWLLLVAIYLAQFDDRERIIR